MSGDATWDVVIAGAGPAGSAAALAALRAHPGARVLLLDPAPLGRDKVCGDGIAPHAVAEFEALGVEGVRYDEVVPVVRIAAPGGADVARPTDRPGYVVPRAVFDERLARAALEAGAVLERHRVREVRQDATGVVVDDRHRGRVLIGADGAIGGVRRALGLPANAGRALAVAVRGYAPAPPSGGGRLDIRLDTGRGAGLSYGWAFPCADGRVNVGYGVTSAGAAGGRRMLEAGLARMLPEYDLQGVRLTGHPLPLSLERPPAATGRVLLAGDAASLISPLTGEGIYAAVLSGRLAGEAAVADPAVAGARYRRDLARRFRRQHRQVRMLSRLLASRRLPAVVVAACRAEPALFDRLLDVGLGDASFRPGDLARFAHAAVG